MEIVNSIALDFARRTMPITVFAKQYDKDTRKIEITPLNNGSPYTLENGVTARIQMTKPDGKTVINNATIGSGKITVTLTAQCLTAAGTAIAEIGLYKGSTLLSSQTFYIDIFEAAYDESAPESSDEYNALVDALNQAEAILQTKIAGISIDSDISAEDLADALWDDLYMESYAKYQKYSIPTEIDIKSVAKGQYYYSTERKVIGVKISAATSPSGPAPTYIEAYSTEVIDDMIGDIETLLSQV